MCWPSSSSSIAGNIVRLSTFVQFCMCSHFYWLSPLHKESDTVRQQQLIAIAELGNPTWRYYLP